MAQPQLPIRQVTGREGHDTSRGRDAFGPHDNRAIVQFGVFVKNRQEKLQRGVGIQAHPRIYVLLQARLLLKDNQRPVPPLRKPPTGRHHRLNHGADFFLALPPDPPKATRPTHTLQSAAQFGLEDNGDG